MTSATYVRYNSDNFQLSFEYPEEWMLLKNEGLGGLQMFPDGKDAEDYTNNLSILIRSQAQVNHNNQDTIVIIANELLKSNMQNFPNHILLGLESFNFGYAAARNLLFVYSNKDGSVMMSRQVVWLEKNKLYLCSFVAREKDYHHLVQHVERILQSITLY